MGRLKKLRETIINASCGHRVVFHHVPKCGGTSIEHGLKVRYAFSYGSFDLPSIYSSVEALHPGFNRDQVEEVTATFRKTQLLSYLYEDRRCVAGHCYFSPTAHEIFSNKYAFITTLRDPVEFFISFFFEMKSAKQARWQNNLSFDDFLQTPRAQLFGKFYALYFSGLPPTDVSVATRGVSLAKDNLRKFAAVGFVHEMGQFKTKVEELIGIRLLIRHANRSAESSAMRMELNSAVRKKIEQLSAPNIEIYEFAKRELIS